MAGVITPLFGKCPFDFAGLDDNLSQEVALVKNFEVSPYDEATLIVRAHTRDIDTGGTIAVDVYNSNPSVEDPSVDFTGASAATGATVTAGSTSALFTSTVTGAFGPAFEIRAKGSRTTGTNLDADISADLVLKQATDERATIQLFSKRKLDFDSLASPGTEEIVLVKALDVSAYTEATLLVRIHEIDIGSSRDLDIEIYETAPACDDPSVDFVGSEALIAARIDGKSAGDLVAAPIATPIGSHLRIVAKATNPVSPGGSSFDATVSAELVVHSRRKSYPTIRIQRGESNFGASADTLAVGIKPVRSTSRAFARITGVQKCSGGPSATTTVDKNNDDLSCTCVLSDTDEVTLTRESGGEDADYRMFWEVWEYVGPSGGEHEFVTRYQNEVTISVSSFSTDQTISGVSDANDCVPFITGARVDTNGQQSRRVNSTGKIISASTVRVERASDLSTAVISIAVVEFTGSAWSVENNIEHTIVTAGVTETETITDVTSWTTAFIESSMRMGSFANDDIGYICWPGNTTTVNFRLRSTAQVLDHVIIAHVVKSADLSVQHLDSVDGGGDNLPTGVFEVDMTITRVADLARTGVLATANCYDQSINYPEPHWMYRLTSENTLNWWRGRSPGQGDWAYNVVEFPTL